MTRLLYILLIFPLLLCACIEDDFDTSASAQPSFAVEELDMGLQFTENPSPTAQLMVYNRNSKQINISEIALRDGRHFRINVDGQSGERFSNVEIRGGDSIYIFVECTLPTQPTSAMQEMSDAIIFRTNGVEKALTVKASAQNVTRHRAERITASTTWSAEQPHVIFDSLVVAKGCTLTLPAGTQLLFHDKGSLRVEGTLRSLGTAEAPVVMKGDRTGNVVADISFEVMSNQWEGVTFDRESADNLLQHTDICNSRMGVLVDSLASLTLINSRLTNCSAPALMAWGGSKIVALGSELSNSGTALFACEGGDFTFNRCTLANWYLFALPAWANVELLDAPNTTLTFTNSVIYGRGTPVSRYDKPEEANIWFKRVLFAVDGKDDARYLNCLWGSDPKLDYDLKEYTFDYSPLPDSPCLEAADASLDHPDLPALDRRGQPRGLTLGALSTVPAAKQHRRR